MTKAKDNRNYMNPGLSPKKEIKVESFSVSTMYRLSDYKADYFEFEVEDDTCSFCKDTKIDIDISFNGRRKVFSVEKRKSFKELAQTYGWENRFSNGIVYEFFDACYISTGTICDYNDDSSEFTKFRLVKTVIKDKDGLWKVKLEETLMDFFELIKPMISSSTNTKLKDDFDYMTKVEFDVKRRL